jgi:hypothetical protein
MTRAQCWAVLRHRSCGVWGADHRGHRQQDGCSDARGRGLWGTAEVCRCPSPPWPSLASQGLLSGAGAVFSFLVKSNYVYHYISVACLTISNCRLQFQKIYHRPDLMENDFVAKEQKYAEEIPPSPNTHAGKMEMALFAIIGKFTLFFKVIS